jgi:hypothetical protein
MNNSQMTAPIDKPSMTRIQALIIHLLDAYSIPGDEPTKLEIQELAYFLQEAGETLELSYEKHIYGLYSDNLNHVSRNMEGRFICGYGDGSSRASIYVLPEGREMARDFLAAEPQAQERLEQVRRLTYGFESPYGLELLATVHWAATKEPNPARNPEEAIALVHEWSDRNRRILKPHHIRKAWQRLEEQNWFTQS